MHIEIAGQELLLLPERAVFWVEKKWLLFADVHLGKATHFRKHGAAIPSGPGNFQRMDRLIHRWKPEKVVFLGDLFHSSKNAIWNRFSEFTKKQPCDFILIKGNHDLLGKNDYADARLELIPSRLINSGLALCHEPDTCSDLHDHYELAGHIHPGIRLEGKGRQSLRLPCFAFGQKQGILPAFGDFTGLALIEAKPGSRYFVPVEDRVLEL